MEMNGLEAMVVGVAGFLAGLGSIYRFVRALFKRRWDQHVRLTLVEHRNADGTISDAGKLKADLLNG